MSLGVPKVKKQAAQFVIGGSPKRVTKAVRLLWNNHQRFNLKSDCDLAWTTQVFLLASEVYDKKVSDGTQLVTVSEHPIAMYVGNILDGDTATFTVITLGLGDVSNQAGGVRYTECVGIQATHDYIKSWASKRFSVPRSNKSLA